MWEQIRSNRYKSVIVITGMAAVLVLLGYVIGLAALPHNPGVGVVGAIFLWCVLWGTAAAGGSSLLLLSAGTRPITREDHPRLFNIVEEMTIASGLPKPPAVHIIDSDVPNAFAVGSPKESAVAVTTGLLMKLNRDELQGVVAHEISHIMNRDTSFMTLAGVMLGAIVLLSDAFLRGVFYSGRSTRRSSRGGGQAAALILIVAVILAILAPVMAQLLYFAASRRREYLADASAARLTRYPEGLASALEKISAEAEKMDRVNRVIAPMYIVNPLQLENGWSGLFSTHPPTRERIRILRAMGGGAAYQEYERAFRKVTGRKGVIGPRTLSEDHPLPGRRPSEEPEPQDLVKVRQAVDILHRAAGLKFLNCECGLRMKVPPSFRREMVDCPRCGRPARIGPG